MAQCELVFHVWRDLVQFHMPGWVSSQFLSSSIYLKTLEAKTEKFGRWDVRCTMKGRLVCCSSKFILCKQLYCSYNIHNNQYIVVSQKSAHGWSTLQVCQEGGPFFEFINSYPRKNGYVTFTATKQPSKQIILQIIVYLVQSQYKLPMSITPTIFVIGIWNNQ